MTNKGKRATREYAAARGMSYQAAFNQLRQPGGQDPPNPPEDDDIGMHEQNCDLMYWRPDLGQPKPECTCLGIDFSQPLLDGDDYYD